MKALVRMSYLDTTILSIEKLDVKQPTFVYSKSKIQAQIKEIRSAFSIFGDDVELLYAIKANNFSPIIELFKTNNFGFHISTIGEFRKLNVSNSNTYVSYTAPYISKEILDQEDIYINCNTLKEVNMVAKTNRKDIGLRVNSGHGWSLIKTADEGKEISHFGEDYNAVFNTTINSKVTRLHMHNNSDSIFRT